jgi:type III pantothenate kinase
MRLTIDIGNTRTKVAVFEKHNMLFMDSYNDICISDIKKIISNYPLISKVIYSSVGFIVKKKDEIKDFLKSSYFFIEMSNELILPINNQYKSPKTLGKDRLAAVVAAYNLFPNNNCLVIDAGTCITIDFIDKDKNYLGGSISLGINMKYNALHTFTQSLPLIDDKCNNKDIIGYDTKSSICSGVLNGTVMELKGFIDYYTNRYSGLKIIFTGGDAKILQNYFKENTQIKEHLVLYGLNIILETNDKKN